MVNVVFAKMDTYMRYGSHESIDIRKLYGGKTQSSSARTQQLTGLKGKNEILDSGLRTKDQPVNDEGAIQNESSSSGTTG